MKMKKKMTEELAFFKMEAVEDWNAYTRIMDNYLLESAVPILFNDLLEKCHYFTGDGGFDNYKIRVPGLEDMLRQIGTDSGIAMEENAAGVSSDPLIIKKGDKELNANGCYKKVREHIGGDKTDYYDVRTYYVSALMKTLTVEKVEKKEVMNWHYLPDQQIKGGRTPWKENNAHQAAWTNILKKQLAVFSKHRLLGEQTADMRQYHCNSYNYIRLMGKIFMHVELPASQEEIRKEFLQMLRDYVLRNVPGLPENKEQLLINKLLAECEELYKDNSKYNRNQNETYYADFSKVPYAAALLKQIKEIAAQNDGKQAENPLLDCYLGNVEYLYTFVLYVYMAEYLMYKSPDSTPHQKEYNLIRTLGRVDYKTYFDDYVESLKKKKKD